MPRPRADSKASFSVSPWQTKRSASKASSAASGASQAELYNEVFLPLVAAAANGQTAELDRGGTGSHGKRRVEVQHQQGAEIEDEQPDRQAADSGGAEGHPAERDAHFDGQQHVPTISGFADIAVMKAADDGLIGHVRDSRGAVAAQLHSEVLLRRQECTRDDDWSLHLLRISVRGQASSLTLLAERSGEDAIRLRAPPAPHGAEDDVDALLAGSEAAPMSGVRLEFDCESLWEASSAQAHAIAAGLDLAPNSIAAVNTGRLQLGPCAV